MAVNGYRVTVTDEPTEVTTGVADADHVAGRSVLVTNTGSGAVDLGAEDVETGEGYSLAEDASVALDLAQGETLYAVTASGTCDVHVLESGV